MARSQTPESHTVIIRFLDDEIIEGRLPAITFDEPNLVLQVSDGTSNNERALIPLPAIKRVTLDQATPSAAESGRDMRKVAMRFQDGEVLKGYLDGELQHAVYGMTLRLMTVERDRIETLGVPYTALKALFYLKSWDSRPPEFSGEADSYLTTRLKSPLVDLMSDIGELEKMRKRGAISESEFQRKRRKILDKI
ncbi:MAG TPA: SHOCT domain-containing protein [Candidatus Limnocylindrales bacterium]|nr:SHOCT domain-containing protein [Candidatus Limnocylindrales bacterium]